MKHLALALALAFALPACILDGGDDSSVTDPGGDPGADPGTDPGTAPGLSDLDPLVHGTPLADGTDDPATPSCRAASDSGNCVP